MDALTKQGLLSRYAVIIDHILSSTNHPVRDEEYRFKVAKTIASSIRMSKTQGKPRTPKQTDIYKLATILKDARSWDAFSDRLAKAFPNGGQQHKPYVIVERFDLDWKCKFKVPNIPIKRRPRNKPDTVVSTLPPSLESMDASVTSPTETKGVTKTPPVESMIAEHEPKGDYVTKEAYEGLISKVIFLEQSMKELVKTHRHVDGKVMVLKEL